MELQNTSNLIESNDGKETPDTVGVPEASESMENGTKFPSRVIHLAHLSDQIQQSDIETLFQEFGVVEKVVMMHSRHQALVQMLDIAGATVAVEQFQREMPSKLGRNACIEFSSHQELNRTIKKTNRFREPSLPEGERRKMNSLHPVNRILLTKIHNPIWPITTDVIYQVFSRYGTLEKIVIFAKNGVLQAFIQFENERSAENAKNTIDGQNIYPGGCTLVISFSTVEELNVKENSLRTRDYTNPNLPIPAVDAPLNPFDNTHKLRNSRNPLQPGILGVRPGSLLHIPVMAVENPMQPSSHRPHNPVGDPSCYPSHDNSSSYMSQGTPVLLVCGLDSEKATCDALFNLFSCFGNVSKIKKLHNKVDHALIQMANHTSAVSAIAFLRGCQLFGSPLEIRLSKHQNINATSEEDTKYLKDYTSSPLNRFIGKYANSTRYICSPTKILHVSNLVDTLTDEEIGNHFSQFGEYEFIKALTNSSGGHRQVLFQYVEVGQATDALALGHNSVLAGKKLRVAFSKNTITRATTA